MDPLALDPDVITVVDGYRTCEFATLSRTGVPIAWPTSPLRKPDGSFLVTTSIGAPQKVVNIRRDARVAMLFSDPTGSGVHGGPEVLVQGTATAPDEIMTTPAGAEDLWRRLAVRQPNPRPEENALMRRLVDWYYMRLYITVTPTAITTRPAYEPPTPPTEPSSGAAAALTGFPTAVLGTSDAEGSPRLLRVGLGPVVDGVITLDAPDDADLRPGPAGLLGHSHDDLLWNLRTGAVLGELVYRGGAWRFAPTRVLSGGISGPIGQLRSMAGMRRTAARYLARRNLPRPRVAWDEFIAVKRSARS
jgi:hypothetical protein